ncbi:MAG: hypothetical protein L0958_01495 [Candidatus Mariimomonas ferrooxydans]
MNNSIMVIHPYKYEGTWVFDDKRVGLVREAFVSGADTIIDKMVEDIPNAEKGFTLLFSSKQFPGHQVVEFEWIRKEDGGNWYNCKKINEEGWLCPALFKYFDEAPQKIYAQFKEKKN